MLKILKKGILSTIQDDGRHGYQRFGVPVCGAMDLKALYIANILAGNKWGEAAIEIIGGGLSVLFEESCVFALSGANMGAKLDGVAVENNCACLAKDGQILELAMGQDGFCGYLAISGGLDIPLALGSKSTYLKGGFGGIKGRPLAQGDEIGFCQPRLWLTNLGKRVWSDSLAVGAIRVILGPQADCFCFRGIKTFFSEQYKISKDSDRMGYRLSGAKIDYAKGQDGNIISDGIVRGSVQVSGGQPMIMMADGQTTGGYAKIATVISCDLPRLAQMRAGETVRFSQVSQQEARDLFLLQRRTLLNFENDINHMRDMW